MNQHRTRRQHPKLTALIKIDAYRTGRELSPGLTNVSGGKPPFPTCKFALLESHTKVR